MRVHASKVKRRQSGDIGRGGGSTDGGSTDGGSTGSGSTGAAEAANMPLKPSTKTGKMRSLAGMILRRQLLVLLRHKVWLAQARHEGDISTELAKAYIGSFASETMKANSTPGAAPGVVSGGQLADPCLRVSEDDRAACIDLRSFVDPSPFAVGELMPLGRVYRLFNEMGVRHLPVLREDRAIVGIITRKDLNGTSMERHIVSLSEMGGASGVQQGASDVTDEATDDDDMSETTCNGSSHGERTRGGSLNVNNDGGLASEDGSEEDSMSTRSREAVPLRRSFEARMAAGNDESGRLAGLSC